jgi:uncharacterized protein
MNWLETPCIAFEGSTRIAHGALKDVALACKPLIDQASRASHPLPILIFDQATSETIEVDWRGTFAEFELRLAQRAGQMVVTGRAPNSEALSGSANASSARTATNPLGEMEDPPRGPGRPRLGVVAREVTLLPRHWDWLATQTGGASVALRKLVEVARLASELKDRERKARAVGYKFMSTIAGHEVGFEEASRALFAGNQAGFEALIALWPEDVQTHLKTILADAFGALS